MFQLAVQSHSNQKDGDGPQQTAGDQQPGINDMWLDYGVCLCDAGIGSPSGSGSIDGVSQAVQGKAETESKEEVGKRRVADCGMSH